MTRDDWTSIGKQLGNSPEIQDRIRQAWRATDANRFDVFIGVAEAVESGVDELVVYAVDLIERMWT